MRRGEMRWVDLEPVGGAESAKRRPAVLASNDGANTTANCLGRGVVTVVPVTSNVERIHPFQVLLAADESGLARDSTAHAEQVSPVAVERVGRRTGALDSTGIAALDEAPRLHLAL